MTEEKKEKKQLVKVESFNTGYTQKPQSISFALVSNPASGRKQVMGFQNCRDYLSDALHAHIHNSDRSVYRPGTNPSIDLDKLRLLIGRHFNDDKARKKFVENIFSAKRLLNFYEDVADWKRSKITTVNHSTLKYDAWLITGPKEWVQYTNLLSITTLLFRIIGNHGPIKFSNNGDIERWFYNLIEQYIEDKNNSHVFHYDSDLSSYLPHCWDKFYMIMKHHKEIFTLPLDKIFPAGVLVHGAGGIVSLCKFCTDNKTLDTNMLEVYKKFKKEKYKKRESDNEFYRIEEEFIEQKKLEDEENRIRAGVNSIW